MELYTRRYWEQNMERWNIVPDRRDANVYWNTDYTGEYERYGHVTYEHYPQSHRPYEMQPQDYREYGQIDVNPHDYAIGGFVGPLAKVSLPSLCLPLDHSILLFLPIL